MRIDVRLPVILRPNRRVLALLATAALVVPGLAGTGQAATVPAGGAVQVSLGGGARPVTPTLLGLNGVNTTGPQWDTPALDAALSTFAPGVIRYPGGTDANYWAWQPGWFQPGRWPAEPSVPVNDTLGVFAAALNAAGAAPLFNLNVLTYNGAIGSAAENTTMLNGQLSFLNAAAAQGMPVTRVELGNELYLNGALSTGKHARDYQTRFPAATDYATQMNTWIAAIHKAFPGVQIAAVATDANDINGINPRRTGWNAAVLPVLTGENAVTIHEIMRILDPAATPVNLLAFPYQHFQKLAAHELKLFSSRNLPVWITAFNMEDLTPTHVFTGTWLQGLFVAEQALRFLTVPAIQYVGLDESVGPAKAAFFDGPQGFGSGGPQTVPMALTANGTTLAMIQAAFHRAASAQPVNFTPNPQLGTTGAPALLGDALSTSAGTELLIENLSSQPVTLDLSGIFTSGFNATQVSAPSVMTLVTGPSSTVTSTSHGTSTLQIGPYALADVSSG